MVRNCVVVVVVEGVVAYAFASAAFMCKHFPQLLQAILQRDLRLADFIVTLDLLLAGAYIAVALL